MVALYLRLRNSATKIAASLLLVFYPKLYRRIFFRKVARLDWTNVKLHHREPELLILHTLVNLVKGKLIVDIGANIGEYLFIAERLTNGSDIIAFEPVPILNQRLKKVFPNCEISSLALSDAVGRASFKIPLVAAKQAIIKGYANATLETEYQTPGEIAAREETIEVEVGTIDNYFINKNRKLGLIKIDVEGHEKKVILGGINRIKFDKPILIIEIEQRFHKENIVEIIRLIISWGYKCIFYNYEIGMFEDVNKFDISMQDVRILGEWGYVNNFTFLPLEYDNAQIVQSLNNQLSK